MTNIVFLSLGALFLSFACFRLIRRIETLESEFEELKNSGHRDYSNSPIWNIKEKT